MREVDLAEKCAADQAADEPDVMKRLKQMQQGGTRPPACRYSSKGMSSNPPKAPGLRGAPPKQKNVQSAMDGAMDVPVKTTVGLILGAAKNPKELASKWIQAAKEGVEAHKKELNARDLGELGLELSEQYFCSDFGLPVNGLVATENAPLAVQDTMYCPVKFTRDPRTWWAMVNTGAQVSIISSGLVDHLNLLDSKDAKAYDSGFTVSGFDGTAKLKMPILEVWVRMGSRGGDERWEKI